MPSHSSELSWNDLFGPRAETEDGQLVTLTGWMCPLDVAPSHSYFLLTREPICCLSCLPSDTLTTVEVFADPPLAPQSHTIRLTGLWKRLPPDDPTGWRFQLAGARVEPFGKPQARVTRRSVLAAGPFLSLAACAAPPGTGSQTQVQDQTAVPPQPVAPLPALTGLTIDVHSHAGRPMSRSGNDIYSTGPVANPMRAGGMAAISLAVVADAPVTRNLPDGRIRAERNPSSGELYAWSQRAFKRSLDLARDQSLAIVTDSKSLLVALGAQPALIMASEGADFLEGKVERVEEAFRLYHMRHLQLTHYRVNELGDIQTESPVHGGLTPFGVEVVREANRLGIVVDVAHGTFDLVKRAAAVTTKPLVLSHTSLTPPGRRNSRTITPDHAKLIAETKGVIGVWPPLFLFPTLETYAAGMAQMVDVVGIDHVALGSDMLGLPGGACFSDYSQLPQLDAALAAHGFKAEERGKLLGGNYARVFAATVGGLTPPARES